MKQIVVTLGLVTNNQQAVSPALVRKHLAQRFQGLSVIWGEGLCQGKWEPCYTLTIGYESPDERGEIIGKLLSLAQATNQEADHHGHADG